MSKTDGCSKKHRCKNNIFLQAIFAQTTFVQTNNYLFVSPRIIIFFRPYSLSSNFIFVFTIDAKSRAPPAHKQMNRLCNELPIEWNFYSPFFSGWVWVPSAFNFETHKLHVEIGIEGDRDTCRREKIKVDFKQKMAKYLETAFALLI